MNNFFKECVGVRIKNTINFEITLFDDDKTRFIMSC